MPRKPEPRDERYDELDQDFQASKRRSISQRASETLRRITEVESLSEALLKISIVLIGAWLLAAAIQQLVIILLVIGAILLIFDVIRRNILR
jgi:F0F1-type ATP synthase assembly protein I